jgi:hypothetical protein
MHPVVKSQLYQKKFSISPSTLSRIELHIAAASIIYDGPLNDIHQNSATTEQSCAVIIKRQAWGRKGSFEEDKRRDGNAP